MKLKLTLLAATLFAFAASTTFADNERYSDSKPGKAEAMKEGKSEAKKPMKKHSHAEEKSGMPMHGPAGMNKNEAMKRKDMHDHTKDRH
jgi:hypothetical protein